MAMAPALFLEVVTLLAQNDFAEAERCLGLCTDTYTNAVLWQRVIDVHHAVRDNVPRAHPARYTPTLTRLAYWAARGDVDRVRATLARGARVDADVLLLACPSIDVHRRNADGETAQDVAERLRDAEVAAMLRDFVAR